MSYASKAKISSKQQLKKIKFLLMHQIYNVPSLYFVTFWNNYQRHVHWWPLIVLRPFHFTKRLSHPLHHCMSQSSTLSKPFEVVLSKCLHDHLCLCLIRWHLILFIQVILPCLHSHMGSLMTTHHALHPIPYKHCQFYA